MADSAEKKKDASAAVLQMAFNDQSIPRFYGNGFSLGLGNADITLVYQLDGKPIAITHLSFTLAKTLVEKLGGLVKTLEEAVKQDLVTTDKIDVAMRAAVPSKDGAEEATSEQAETKH